MKQLGELLRITTKEAIELVKLNHIEIIKPVGGWEAVSRADAEKLLGYPIPPEWDNVGIPLEQTLEEIKKMKRLKEQINTSNPNPTNKMNKNNAYFTCKAVGDAVGLTSQTISAWRDKGELEAVGTHIKRESVLTKWGQAVLDKLDGTTSIEEKDNDDPDSSILAEIKTAKATLELKKLQLELQKLYARSRRLDF